MGLLRFFLALSVVVAHGAALPGVALMPAQTAVEIFFVISGFYMSLILRTKYQDRIGAFYLNRALRLYPAYLLVLLGTWAWFAAIWAYLGRPPMSPRPSYYANMHLWQAAAIVLSNVTMIGQDVLRLLHYKIGAGFFFIHTSPIDASGQYLGDSIDGAKWVGEFQEIGQAWSLGLEVWFYALAPLLVRVRSWGLVALAALSFGVRWWMQDGETSFFSYYFFPANIGFFLVGVLLERGRKRIAAPGIWARSALIALIPACILFAAAFPSANLPYYLAIPLIPTLFALTKESRWDTELGNLSYPIYLCHGLIFIVLTAFHKNSAFSYILLVLLASVAIYRLVEVPIEVLRQRIAAKKAPATIEPTTVSFSVASTRTHRDL